MASDPFSEIQGKIDDYVARINKEHGVKLGVVVCAATSTASQVICSNQKVVTRAGSQITLDPTTTFAIGSVSKLFTVGIYNSIQDGEFGTTLGTLLSGTGISSAVGALTVQDLTAYSSGFMQDNGGPNCPKPGYGNMTHSLQSIFKYLGTLDTLAYTPGQTYAYSNLGMSLASMAALEVDASMTNDQFANALNNKLIDYCQTFNVDTGSTPTTVVYSQIDETVLPVGYDSSYQPQKAAPCPIPEYGSGGIVSNGGDMLQFLLYCMSSGYPYTLQQEVWQLPGYCPPNNDVTVGYGWFIDKQTVDGNTVVSKDGAVPGFTSWLGLQQKASESGGSPYGVVVLVNGPNATWLGRQCLGLLMGATTELVVPERAFNSWVS